MLGKCMPRPLRQTTANVILLLKLLTVHILPSSMMKLLQLRTLVHWASYTPGTFRTNMFGHILIRMKGQCIALLAYLSAWKSLSF